LSGTGSAAVTCGCGLAVCDLDLGFGDRGLEGLGLEGLGLGLDTCDLVDITG